METTETTAQKSAMDKGAQYERRVTAYHEAGHVAAYAEVAEKHGMTVAQVVGEASILGNRGSRGRVRPIFGFTFDEEPTILYAGWAAMSEFDLVDPLNGWEGDFEKADEMIRMRICFDRHKEMGIPLFVRQVEPDTHIARKEWRKQMKVAVKELQPHQKKFKAAARKLVHRHRAYIEKVAQLLLERKTVQGSELPEL